MDRSDSAEATTRGALEQSERAGLALGLAIRGWLLAALMAFAVLGQQWPQGLVGGGFLLGFLLIGFLWRRMILRRQDRVWMRYAFQALEITAVGVAAVYMPLTTGGEVPQILVFRVYGIDVLFFLLAISALSLSPALVLWTGGCAVAALWGAWGTIVLGMERRLSWADMPASSSAEVYLALVLDPDFVATGSRVIESFLLIATALVIAAAVQRARRLLAQRVSAERARAEVTQVFGSFVPTEVATRLAEAGGRLPPEKRVASVLFVDIAGFTRFAENAAPDQVVHALDAFFAMVEAEVAAHRGVVISLIGDAAMAAFNAPLDNSAHAADAIRAAEAIRAQSSAQEFGGERFAVRIGVATGSVAAGTVGGTGRRAYTLYGDTVNLAQRLEEANKAAGTAIMIDGATWKAAGSPGGYVPHGSMAVRGRGAEIAAYTRGPD
ncbi:MAG: adenylate/guanylate cyclase domain-containing protein [Pseudomonadota bacterium]